MSTIETEPITIEVAIPRLLKIAKPTTNSMIPAAIGALFLRLRLTSMGSKTKNSFPFCSNSNRPGVPINKSASPKRSLTSLRFRVMMPPSRQIARAEKPNRSRNLTSFKVCPTIVDVDRGARVASKMVDRPVSNSASLKSCPTRISSFSASCAASRF